MDEKYNDEHRRGRETGRSDPWMSKENQSSRQLATSRAVQRLEACRDEASLALLGIRWRVPVEQPLSQGVVSKRKSRKGGSQVEHTPRPFCMQKVAFTLTVSGLSYVTNPPSPPTQ